MYIDRIREVFAQYNYRADSHMNQQNFYAFLSQLSVRRYLFQPGQAYDPDVAAELWDQAAKGSQFIEVNSLCQTINDGIHILQAKLDEINGNNLSTQMRFVCWREKKFKLIIQMVVQTVLL